MHSKTSFQRHLVGDELRVQKAKQNEILVDQHSVNVQLMCQ